MTHDPDFEPAGKVYPTVQEIDQRLLRWQDRGFVSETLFAALAVAAGEDVAPEIARRDETRWIADMIRRSGQPPELLAHVARTWSADPSSEFVAETIGGMQTRVSDLLLTQRTAARQREIYEAEP